MKKIIYSIIGLMLYAGLASADPLLLDVQVTTGPIVGVKVQGKVNYGGISKWDGGLTNNNGRITLRYDFQPSSSTTGKYAVTGINIINGVSWTGEVLGTFNLHPGTTVVHVDLPLRRR
jgi:hypothetical protein